MWLFRTAYTARMQRRGFPEWAGLVFNGCSLPLDSRSGRLVFTDDGNGTFRKVGWSPWSIHCQDTIQGQGGGDGVRIHIRGDPVFPAELPGDVAVLILPEKGGRKTALVSWNRVSLSGQHCLRAEATLWRHQPKRSISTRGQLNQML